MMDFKLNRIPNRDTMIIGALILVSAFMLYQTVKSQPCKNACENLGYADFKYLAAGRYDYPAESCHCLTLEESHQSKTLTKGTKIKL